MTAITKKQLDAVAASVKECPEAVIHLTVHAPKRKSLQNVATQQLNAIKNYLTEQGGIVTDRIKTDEATDAVSNNSVDVTPQ